MSPWSMGRRYRAAAAHVELDALRVIEEEPGRLIEVPGLGPKRTAMSGQAWEEQKTIKEMLLFSGLYPWQRRRCVHQDQTVSRVSHVALPDTKVHQADTFRSGRQSWFP
jgi:hypothetical protein